jgi:DNA (cytosine-5)-methyltransferase 1
MRRVKYPAFFFYGGTMKEPSLFDFPQYQINKKIRLIELFGGIGSQAMALRDLGADFENYRLVEIDKHAVKVYNAIHNTSFTPADIKDVKGVDLGTEREREKYCYLLTYSFPCTDLSIAGKMGGMSKTDWENGNSTRSGLLWEVERILNEIPNEALPNVLLMENVPQVHAEANEIDFERWLKYLRGRGYYNFYKDLNSKEYGIPQNRDRCFCVSILSDDFVDFEFPDPVKLTSIMKDFLEESVADKYYVNTEKVKNLITDLQKNGTLETLENGGADCDS